MYIFQAALQHSFIAAINKLIWVFLQSKPFVHSIPTFIQYLFQPTKQPPTQLYSTSKSPTTPKYPYHTSSDLIFLIWPHLTSHGPIWSWPPLTCPNPLLNTGKPLRAFFKNILKIDVLSDIVTSWAAVTAKNTNFTNFVFCNFTAQIASNLKNYCVYPP